jgi:hypothetical protein
MPSDWAIDGAAVGPLGLADGRDPHQTRHARADARVVAQDHFRGALAAQVRGPVAKARALDRVDPEGRFQHAADVDLVAGPFVGHGRLLAV